VESRTPDTLDILSSVCTRPYSYGWVRSRSPIHGGGDERLGGGGSLAGSADAGSSRFPDGRGHGARGRTQNAYRYYPAFSTGRRSAKRTTARRRESVVLAG